MTHPNDRAATTTTDTRQEVHRRLHALTEARPDRRTHLAIDIAQHGAPLPIHIVRPALEDLWVDGKVETAGRGWRLPPQPVDVQLELGDG